MAFHDSRCIMEAQSGALLQECQFGDAPGRMCPACVKKDATEKNDATEKKDPAPCPYKCMAFHDSRCTMEAQSGALLQECQFGDAPGRKCPDCVKKDATEKKDPAPCPYKCMAFQDSRCMVEAQSGALLQECQFGDAPGRKCPAC